MSLVVFKTRRTQYNIKNYKRKKYKSTHDVNEIKWGEGIYSPAKQ